MKSNKNILLIAFCMVMAATILLTSGIMAIAEFPDESKSYESDGFVSGDVNAEIEDAPESQSSLQEKYSVFIHEENEGKRAVLFTKEQAAELLAVRENRSRRALSYDEILFLINDSQRLYFAYEEIVLDTALVERIGLTDYLLAFDGTIRTTDPETDYAKVMREIYCITIYRLYLHDSGLICMTTGMYHEQGTQEFTLKFLFEGDEIPANGSISLSKRIFLLSVDGGTEVGEEYNRMLTAAYQSHSAEHMKCAAPDGSDVPAFDQNASEAPLLIIDMPSLNSYQFVRAYQIVIADKNTAMRGTLFPTVELDSLKPDGYFDRIYTFPTENVLLRLNGYTQQSATYELTGEERASLMDILDNEDPWEQGVHTHSIDCRFELDGTSINYCCGALYATDGTHLALTDEERAFIDSLVEKYS